MILEEGKKYSWQQICESTDENNYSIYAQQFSVGNIGGSGRDMYLVKQILDGSYQQMRLISGKATITNSSTMVFIEMVR